MNLIRVAACFSMLAFLPACSHDGDCDIIDVRDYPSPDGSYVLTSFGYTCYDTTGNDMHLQLRRPSDKLSVPGNVCTVLFAGDFSVFWIPLRRSLAKGVKPLLLDFIPAPIDADRTRRPHPQLPRDPRIRRRRSPP